MCAEKRNKIENLLANFMENCYTKEEQLDILADAITAVDDICFEYYDGEVDVCDVLKVWRANQEKAYSSIIQQLGGI